MSQLSTTHKENRETFKKGKYTSTQYITK